MKSRREVAGRDLKYSPKIPPNEAQESCTFWENKDEKRISIAISGIPSEAIQRGQNRAIDLECIVTPKFIICPKCKESKSVTEFHSKGKGRWEALCKSCSNARKSERRKKKKKLANRKRAKNQTLQLEEIEILGELDHISIEAFGKSYGDLIQELLK